MVVEIIEKTDEFVKVITKIKDQSIKERLQKLISKIIIEPEIGKPMRYERKGSREIYMHPYRIAYKYIPEDKKIIFLDIYHKDEQ